MQNLDLIFSPNKRYIRYNIKIGNGAMKTVYKGYDLNEGKIIAWNIINTELLSHAFQLRIIDEINILNKIKNKNKYIMNIDNSWKEGRIINFIRDYASGGDLNKFTKEINFVKLRVIIKWCKQILNAINFLHTNNIIHRDLKPANIFINSSNGDILLGDFGLAKLIKNNTTSIIGTPEYMAPEIYDEKYDKRVDIYSFGLCLLQFLTGEFPYNECCLPAQIWRKITNGIFPESLEKVNNILGKELILKCINHNPDNRPTIKEILEHDFFKIVYNLDEIINKAYNQNDINKKNVDFINKIKSSEEL